MSSTMNTFSCEMSEFLDKPMISEFQAWIKDDVCWRLDVMGYPELIKMEAFNEAINKFLREHTNKDYLECSNNFTREFEKLFISFGVKSHDAIRLAWKWSD